MNFKNCFKKAKKSVNRTGSTLQANLVNGSFVVGTALVSTANAAVPTEASSAITGLATDGAALIAEFWPVATAIVVGLVLFKLFKKGTGAAT